MRRCSKPSTVLCKLCGKRIEWIKVNDTGAGFAYRPFEVGTSNIHRNCGVKVKIFTKEEIDALNATRGPWKEKTS